MSSDTFVGLTQPLVAHYTKGAASECHTDRNNELKDLVKTLSAFLLASAALTAPAFAGGYTNTITDTVKLDVQGAGVQSVRTGSSYAVSGSNVEFTGSGAAIGGLSSGGPYSGSAPATVTPSTAPSIVTPGSAFSFSESAYVGDTVNTSAYTPSSGVISPKVYGNSTVSTGGSAGSLAGSLSAGTSAAGVGSITAGGPGTSATLQRTIDLTVFQ